MHRRFAYVPAIVLAVALLVVPAARGSVENAPTAAAPPTTMTYQGLLRVNGAPANGSFNLQFKLYSQASGGSALYTEADTVTATNGLFTVALGQNTPLPPSLFQGGGPLFLGITVGADPELTPRTPLTTEPFAFLAGTADSATNFSGSLGGDVTGTQAATVVSTVGSKSASSVAGAVDAVNTATNLATVNTLAKRDATGSLNVNTLTAGSLITQSTISLPATTGSTTGVLTLGGNRFLHGVGTNNTFLGPQAGNVTTTGTDNTAVGAAALQSNTSGSTNTAVGSGALTLNQGGGSNTAVGHGALQSMQTGGGNTAVGDGALSSLANSGNVNIAVGSNAGSTYTNGSSNIAIGNLGGAAGESNTIRIGSAQTKTFIAGIAGATVANSVTQVLIDQTTGQLGVLTSSRRFKDAIADLGATSEVLYQLRPVSFVYKPEYGGHPDEPQVGLIAEEVAAVAPWLVVYDNDGQPLTVRYQELPPLLLNELQAQQRTIEQQASEQAALRARLTTQDAAIASLQAQVAALAAQAAPQAAPEQDGRN